MDLFGHSRHRCHKHHPDTQIAGKLFRPWDHDLSDISEKNLQDHRYHYGDQKQGGERFEEIGDKMINPFHG